jgi:hypothetical protein
LLAFPNSKRINYVFRIFAAAAAAALDTTIPRRKEEFPYTGVNDIKKISS